MALYPGKYENYNISTVNRDSASGNDFIYIASVPLERTIVFKAFLESVKLNFTREHEIKKDKDKSDSTYVFHAGNVEYDITINIPAHSHNEAVNNMAKIEELQRLITNISHSIGSSGIISGVSNRTKVTNPLFKVWFKNIINLGSGTKSFPTPENASFTDIFKHGLQCIIDTVNYEPDLDAGFFEFDNFLYPKNIKLTLKMQMEGWSGIENPDALRFPILGFKINGQFAEDDGGFFPFNVRVKTSSTHKESDNVDPVPVEYTTTSLNKIDNSQHGSKNNTYMFISLPINHTSAAKFSLTSPYCLRKRYVVFKGFFDSFSRQHDVEIPKIEGSKLLKVGSWSETGLDTTTKTLSYKVKLILPAGDLEEAKKNCGKIQYLARMFFKPDYNATAEEMVKQFKVAQRLRSILINNLGPNESLNEDNLKLQGFGLANRVLSVYSPSMIEKPGASRGFVDPNNFDSMFSNSISIFLTNFSLDFNMDMGFFVDKDTMIYPKEMSIDLEFQDVSGDVIKNYSWDEVWGEDGYSLNKSYIIPDGKEHLFPYNRKTIKLGD